MAFCIMACGSRQGREQEARTQKSPAVAAVELGFALVVVGQVQTLAIAPVAILRDALDSSRRYSCSPALSVAASGDAKTRRRIESGYLQRRQLM